MQEAFVVGANAKWTSLLGPLPVVTLAGTFGVWLVLSRLRSVVGLIKLNLKLELWLVALTLWVAVETRRSRGLLLVFGEQSTVKVVIVSIHVADTDALDD